MPPTRRKKSGLTRAERAKLVLTASVVALTLAWVLTPTPSWLGDDLTPRPMWPLLVLIGLALLLPHLFPWVFKEHPEPSRS